MAHGVQHAADVSADPLQDGVCPTVARPERGHQLGHVRRRTSGGAVGVEYGPDRGHRLQAPGPTALAGHAVRFHGDVAELSGAAVSAAVECAGHHESAADPVRQPQVQHVLFAGGRAPDRPLVRVSASRHAMSTRACHGVSGPCASPTAPTISRDAFIVATRTARRANSMPSSRPVPGLRVSTSAGRPRLRRAASGIEARTVPLSMRAPTTSWSTVRDRPHRVPNSPRVSGPCSRNRRSTRVWWEAEARVLSVSMAQGSPL